MDEQDFNFKCAKFMGYSPVIKGRDIYIDNYEAFRPYSDANDRNKVIEKMRIETVVSTADIWSCKQYRGVGKEPLCGFENNMETAQVKCIENVLTA